MLKALNQVKSCEMTIATKQEETTLQKAKRKVGLLGKRYPYSDMPTLSELESLISKIV
jgi:hypothetical protein